MMSNDLNAAQTTVGVDKVGRRAGIGHGLIVYLRIPKALTSKLDPWLDDLPKLATTGCGREAFQERALAAMSPS